MIRPTLRQMTYLVALMDEGSFSAAADHCLVTQSTLSAGIKDLENILEQRLVNRHGRTISLTPFGLEVAENAREILTDVDKIVARSRKMQAPLSGPLRLGVIPTIAPYLLPKILPEIQKSYPHLELQLHEDLTDRLLEQIEKRKLDAALIAFPYETPRLQQTLLFEEEFVLIAPKGRKLPKTLSLDDLMPANLLLLDDGHCLRDHALSACKIQIPKTRKTFSATSLPTLIQMVEHGYGVTLLPEMAAHNMTSFKNIEVRKFRKPAPKRQIGMAWPSNSPHGSDLEKLCKTFSSFLKK